MMNQQGLHALARQRTAELQSSAAVGSLGRRYREPGQSLRVRTGWTLVGLGLRLITEPGGGLTGRPGPVGS